MSLTLSHHTTPHTIETSRKAELQEALAEYHIGGLNLRTLKKQDLIDLALRVTAEKREQQKHVERQKEVCRQNTLTNERQQPHITAAKLSVNARLRKLIEEKTQSLHSLQTKIAEESIAELAHTFQWKGEDLFHNHHARHMLIRETCELQDAIEADELTTRQIREELQTLTDGITQRCLDFPFLPSCSNPIANVENCMEAKARCYVAKVFKCITKAFDQELKMTDNTMVFDWVAVW